MSVHRVYGGVDNGALRDARSLGDVAQHHVNFPEKVMKQEGEPRNMEPEKCVGLERFPLSTLPEKVIPHVREALEYIQKGEYYSELSLDQIVKNPI